MYTGSEVGWYATITVAPNSPKARSQVSSSPAQIPCVAKAKLTRRNTAPGGWPSVAATSSSTGSTPANAERAAMMRNGAATNASASTMPRKESVSAPPVSWPSGLAYPSRNSSRIPLASGGSASGNCTTKPSSAMPRPGTRASK